MLVRTHFTLSVMAFALMAAFTAGAQNRRGTMASVSDSVLLSQTTKGDYTVRKYLVKHDKEGSSDFAVRYRINLSTMSPNLDDNSRELAELKAFMDSLAADSLIRIRTVEITGYASPDGVEASNQKLAYARGTTLKNYLDSKYGLSKRYKVSVDGVVEGWDACEKQLNSSNVAGKDKAVAVIRSRESRDEKQRSLKAMPAVWSYLKGSVLPKLRYADVEFGYNRDEIVEVRTPVRKPKPAQEARPVAVANTQRCACCGRDVTDNVIVVEDLTNGMIVMMDDAYLDYD